MSDELQLARRSVLAGLGAASACLAGCSALAGGGDDAPPEYARWDGPSVSGIPGLRDFYYVGLSALRENDRLTDAMAETFHRQATRVAVGGGEADAALSSDSVEYATGGTGAKAVVGEFDAGAVVDLLTEAGWSNRNAAGNPTLTRPSENRYYAAVVGDGAAVSRSAPTAEEAVEAARAILAVGNGEAERYVETNEAAATMVEKLGPGALAAGRGVDTAEPVGSRLTLDGADARWRQVVVAADESAADPEQWREVVESRSERTTGESQPRTRRGRFAVYSEVTVERDGRAVILEGTLPVAELQTTDVGPARRELG